MIPTGSSITPHLYIESTIPVSRKRLLHIRGIWFNPMVNKYIMELANRLAQISADAALRAERLRIV